MSGSDPLAAASGTGGPVPDSAPREAARHSSGTLGDEESELASLQKENFNLKLKLYYLEERVAQLREGVDSSDDEALHEELLQQRILVEEKMQELEERNMLLVKARNAIEALQADLELARAQGGRNESDFGGNYPHGDVSDLQRQLDERDARILELGSSRDRALQEADSLREELSQARKREQEDTVAQSASQADHAALEHRAEAAEARCATRERELAETREELESKSALADQLLSKDEELAKATAEIETLRKQVLEQSEELGKQRGAERALHERAQEVARLEAEEIVRLEEELQKANRRAHAEHSHAARAANIAENATWRLKEVESQLDGTQRRLNESEVRLGMAEEKLKAKDAAARLKWSEREGRLRRERDAVESRLRSQLAEVQGKLSAAVAARDELAVKQEETAADLERAQEDARERLEQTGEEAKRDSDRRVAAAEEEAARRVARAHRRATTERRAREAVSKRLETCEQRAAVMQRVAGEWVREGKVLLLHLLAGSPHAAGAATAVQEAEAQANHIVWGAREAATPTSSPSRRRSGGREGEQGIEGGVWEGEVEGEEEVMKAKEGANGVGEEEEEEEVGEEEEEEMAREFGYGRADLLATAEAASVELVSGSVLEQMQRVRAWHGALQSELQGAKTSHATAEAAHKRRLEALQASLKEVEDEAARLRGVEAEVASLREELRAAKEQGSSAAERAEAHEAEAREAAQQQRETAGQAADLRRRLHRMGDTNRELLAELEERREAMEEGEKQRRSLAEEASSLRSALAEKEQQLSEVAHRLDAQLQQVSEESAQRKSALEGVLREHVAETQGMMQSVRPQLAEGGASESRAATGPVRSFGGQAHEHGGALVLASRSGATSQFSSAAVAHHDIAKDMDTHVDELAELLTQLRSLVHEGHGALERYVTLQREGPRDGAAGGTAGPEGAALDRTLHRLLDRNVQLALQLQQLGTDLQRVYRRFKRAEGEVTRQQEREREMQAAVQEEREALRSEREALREQAQAREAAALRTVANEREEVEAQAAALRREARRVDMLRHRLLSSELLSDRVAREEVEDVEEERTRGEAPQQDSARGVEARGDSAADVSRRQDAGGGAGGSGAGSRQRENGGRRGGGAADTSVAPRSTVSSELDQALALARSITDGSAWKAGARSGEPRPSSLSQRHAAQADARSGRSGNSSRGDGSPGYRFQQPQQRPGGQSRRGGGSVRR